MGISLVLIPEFMLDETLWDTFVANLPGNVNVLHAALTGGTTVSEIARHIADHAPERFVLIGFSLGGYVARRFTPDIRRQRPHDSIGAAEGACRSHHSLARHGGSCSARLVRSPTGDRSAADIETLLSVERTWTIRIA